MRSTDDNTPVALPTSRRAPGDTLTYLRLTGALGTSDDTAWHSIVTDLEWVTVPAGATLLRQGEQAEALYVIVHGSLQAILTHADGSKAVINEVGPGEVVGEVSLVTGGTRTASLYTSNSTMLLKCPYTTCRRLCDTVPQVRESLDHPRSPTFTARPDGQPRVGPFWRA